MARDLLAGGKEPAKRAPVDLLASTKARVSQIPDDKPVIGKPPTPAGPQIKNYKDLLDPTTVTVPTNRLSTVSSEARPEKSIKGKPTYIASRVLVGPTERTLIGLGQTPFQSEKLKRDTVQGVRNDYLRDFFKSALDQIMPTGPALKGKGAFERGVEAATGKEGMVNSYTDEELKESLAAMDPYTSDIGQVGFFTKREQSTRAFYDLQAYERGGKGGRALTRIGEAAMDFAGFMVQLTLLGGKEATAKLLGTTKTTAAVRRLQGFGGTRALASRAGLIKQGTKNAIWAGQALKNASITAMHGFITTPGDPKERANAAMMRALYNITPIGAAYAGVARLPGFLGRVAPRLVDYALNSAITGVVPGGYHQIWVENGKNFDEGFWSDALPQLMLDAFMSASTAGFPEHSKLRNLKSYHNAMVKTEDPMYGKMTFDQFKDKHEKIENLMSKSLAIAKQQAVQVERRKLGQGISKRLGGGRGQAYELPEGKGRATVTAEKWEQYTAIAPLPEREVFNKFPQAIKDRVYDALDTNDSASVTRALDSVKNQIHWISGAPDAKKSKVFYGPRMEVMKVEDAVRAMEADMSEGKGVDPFNIELHMTRAFEGADKFGIDDFENTVYRTFLKDQANLPNFRAKALQYAEIAQRFRQAQGKDRLSDDKMLKEMYQARVISKQLEGYKKALDEATLETKYARLGAGPDRLSLRDTQNRILQKSREFLLSKGYTKGFSFVDPSNGLVREVNVENATLADIRAIFKNMLTPQEQFEADKMSTVESARTQESEKVYKDVNVGFEGPEKEIANQSAAKKDQIELVDRLHGARFQTGGVDRPTTEFSRDFRDFLRSQTMFGWNYGVGLTNWWDRTIGAKLNDPNRPENRKLMELAKQLPTDIKQSVVGAMMGRKRSAKYIQALAARATDATYNAILQQANKEFPVDSVTGDLLSRERQNRVRLYSQIMAHATEEVGHNPNDSLTQYHYTDTGRAHGWSSKEQSEASLSRYTYFRELLGDQQLEYFVARDDAGRPVSDAVKGKLVTSVSKAELQQLSQTRPEGLFFNLLPTHLQNTVIWSKATVEKQVLDRMVASGVLDASNMYDNIKRGFGHRVYDKVEWQKAQGGFGSKGLKGTSPEAQKYETLAEFLTIEGEKGRGLIAIEDFAISVGDYVADGLQRTQDQSTLNALKQIPNPEYAGKSIVTYKREWLKEKDDKGNIMTPEAAMTRAGYSLMPSASGLSRSSKGGFEPPWVHNSIVKTIEQLEAQRGSNVALDAMIKLNGLVKRHVMFSPNMFALQIASSPFIWLPKSTAWRTAVEPVLTGKLIRKGLEFGGMKRRGEITSEFQHLQNQGYDPETLTLAWKNGLRGFDSSYSIEVFLDKAKDTTHPAFKTKAGRLANLFGDKGGINTYAFQYYVAKNMYEYFNTMNKSFLNRGMPKEEAAKRAAKFCNDTSGMLDGNIYGQEGRWMQALFFARDFTASYLRMVTGALYAVKPLRSGLHKAGFANYQVGKRRHLNWLLHGEVPKADLDVLGPMYAQHLAKVMMWKVFMANVIQFGISAMNQDKLPEDEEGKQTGKFAFQNEPGNRLSINTFQPDGSGGYAFIDPLIFREANQSFDILSSAPGMKKYLGGRGAGRWLKGKLSWGAAIAASMYSGQDYMGRPISNAVYFGDKAKDYMRYGFWTAQPTPFRPDIRQAGGSLESATLGAAMKRGKFFRGSPWQTQEQDRFAKAVTDYRRATRQRQTYAASVDELMVMYEADPTLRKMTLDRVYAELGFGHEVYLQKNRSDIIRGYADMYGEEWEDAL